MNDTSEAMLVALERPDTGLSDVTRLVSELETSMPSNGSTTFGLSGNVTVDLLGTYLRKHALLNGSRAEIRMGQFGDHLGNVLRFVAEGVDSIVFLDFFDAFMPAFEARIAEIGTAEVRSLAERYRDELALRLTEAKDIRDVFLTRPHRLSSPAPGATDPIDDAVAVFDEVAIEEAGRHSNVHLVSGGAISVEIGRPNAHDVRSYQRFRAPFTPAFLDAFAAEAYYATRGFGSYYYKALVLDCDGTLWGGILAEDLAEGIKLGPFGYPGSMFWQMQHEVLSLQRRGVLLCLCSKNDQAQVDHLLATHPDMVLRDEHFVAKRIDWNDKVTNLDRLATDLNIGLESIVFLDDSPFECEAVRGRLPMVRTLQVPSDLSEYPALMTKLKRLFAVDSQSSQGGQKTEQYRVRSLANAERQRFADQDEYLASLGIKVTVHRNDRASIPRIAELTQKSNQFNLTTRRYSETEIEALMTSPDADVYSIGVADRFGDSGLTSVVITRGSGDILQVDSFLMSCRVLGRGIEWSFWETIRRDAVLSGRHTLVAEYLPTARNGQVSEFWDRLGLERIAEGASDRREYRSDLASLILAVPTVPIEVSDDF